MHHEDRGLRRHFFPVRIEAGRPNDMERVATLFLATRCGEKLVGSAALSDYIETPVGFDVRQHVTALWAVRACYPTSYVRRLLPHTEGRGQELLCINLYF